MKRLKNFLFILMIGLVTIITTQKVSASYYTTWLDLKYGKVFAGQTRDFDTGFHDLMISVDGLNMKDGKLSTEGTTTIEIMLMTEAGRYLNAITTDFTVGMCVDRELGFYTEGRKYYYFLSKIYTNGKETNYPGLKSNKIFMYPALD